MEGQELHLQKTWLVHERIGSGGFGQVYRVSHGNDVAVAKFVEKLPGAARELLFADLPQDDHIVPVLDHGELHDHIVLLMPLAECSLADHLDAKEAPLTVKEAVEILVQLGQALEALHRAEVVHRDVKPANVLLLNGRWCLADFGIARYAEATTAADTHKFDLSASYAAPERWRGERATIATDIYALGVIAFELVAGHRPFQGGPQELRELHLHAPPPSLDQVNKRLSSLIEECLYKAANARPTPENLLTRLEKIAAPTTLAGLATLEAANHARILAIAESERQASTARTEQERFDALYEAATASYGRIVEELVQSMTEIAPATVVDAGSPRREWRLTLGPGILRISPPRKLTPLGDIKTPVKFAVVGEAQIRVESAARPSGYCGRSHSLYFCDAKVEDVFCWHETAFMHNPMVQRGFQSITPCGQDWGPIPAGAIGPGMDLWQLAWPFSELRPGQLDDFIERWGGWFGSASANQLEIPSTMPERSCTGSWRV